MSKAVMIYFFTEQIQNNIFKCEINELLIKKMNKPKIVFLS